MMDGRESQTLKKHRIQKQQSQKRYQFYKLIACILGRQLTRTHVDICLEGTCGSIVIEGGDRPRAGDRQVR